MFELAINSNGCIILLVLKLITLNDYELVILLIKNASISVVLFSGSVGTKKFCWINFYYNIFLPS